MCIYIWGLWDIKNKSKIISDKNTLESTANTDFTSSGNYLNMRWLSLGFVYSNNQKFSIIFKLILCFDLCLIKE